MGEEGPRVVSSVLRRIDVRGHKEARNVVLCMGERGTGRETIALRDGQNYINFSHCAVPRYRAGDALPLRPIIVLYYLTLQTSASNQVSRQGRRNKDINQPNYR